MRRFIHNDYVCELVHRKVYLRSIPREWATTVGDMTSSSRTDYVVSVHYGIDSPLGARNDRLVNYRCNNVEV